MFIKNANTIILDPRKLNHIVHELGHYLYENGLAFTLNRKRIYKHNFKKIIKDNKNKFDLKRYEKYEDYDLDSEVFAFWFENNINF